MVRRGHAGLCRVIRSFFYEAPHDLESRLKFFIASDSRVCSKWKPADPCRPGQWYFLCNFYTTCKTAKLIPVGSSGKTRVLTCRVAYLIKNTGIDPKDLAVVTFTNKAANEMKNRLYVLLGAKLANEIVMGTFHGVCVRFLRQHGSKVGLKANWVICDRKQQLAYCKHVLKDPKVKARMAGSVLLKFTDESLLDYVSKRKSKGEAFEACQKTKKDPFTNELFDAYNSALRDDNCLDFDDLLTYGFVRHHMYTRLHLPAHIVASFACISERLFRCHPQVISYIRHVLIDEFQDTNVVQYQMMKHMAYRGAVTIVGDPDQGIYGWRSAEVGNLMRMREELPLKLAHPKCISFCCAARYYSLHQKVKHGSDFDECLSSLYTDTQRIDKSLFTSHPKVSLPVLQAFRKPPDESEFIVREIQRLIAHTGGQLNFNDFSILIRYGALSRNVEAALQAAHIPTRMVGGVKFFERTEVKDIIAYLQLADNPMFVPAFDRIANVPARAIGAVTIKAIKEAAKASESNPMEIMRRVVRGDSFPGLSQTHRSKFKKFLCVIGKIQSMARSGSSIVEIIDTLIAQVNYVAHLQAPSLSDADERLQNVEELKSFALHLEGGSSPSSSQPTQSGEDTDTLDWKVLGNDDEALADLEIEPLNSDEEPTGLRRFLTESMLSTDTEAEEGKANKNAPKVTISTCHASKGLEWPVVFVPAVENGIFPFYRCKDEESEKEERRLLFVAMTRAQGLLYLSHCGQRMAGAETRNQSISPFVSSLTTQTTTTKSKSSNNAVFTSKRPMLDETVRQELSDVLSRPMPSKQDVTTAIEKYQRIAGVEAQTSNLQGSDNSQSNYAFQDPSYNRWGSSSTSFNAVGHNGVGSQAPSSSAGRFSSSQPTPTIKPYGFNRPGSQVPPVAAGKFVSTQPSSAMPGFSSAAVYTSHESQAGATSNNTKQFVPVLKAYGFNRPGSQAPPAPKSGTLGVLSATTAGSKNISAPFIPQIPRKPLAPLTEAVQNLPETRLSRGAQVILDLTGDSSSDTAVGSTKVSLAGFQASSSSFMVGLKHTLPQDSNSAVVNKKQKKPPVKKVAGGSTSQKKPTKKGKGKSKA
ncbi:uncharacterized protein MELLADRAFT_87299 [Melampsora larici-populina 98AG31]|uniref:DNA 3'-5' helicase n=1 Tax=Melampsora larici-populina (strain 98AG31 / pathotype 3-4-7) TaxID=747676 RepID=F4RMR3_MELLP|nr:uncharacterized protein MELLADRAFT_87299 [Melampsora larici-populina 98AG31]EGG06154.1 hypothetical protein MELLADRAFT_87299 [Melampsora larici-populina 98AG31]